ncbi:DUF1854 domain-containing protein [Simplicispira hankyongi]|uniref:DUF1854 domain-containing protein n=1 Tax=Simplicispira hankyongi TaxID=2315688 RepID=A0A398C610_9BURK|nr:DUF1854 domain-containing protein [Simplicispira hankyongi]RID98389.1 DUF1854 domain-containing protein [Simplicispira hankyongi]
MSTSNISLQRDSHGRLVLTLADGSEHVGVQPVRAFPIGAPDEGISLLGQDGHERLWVDRLTDLPAGVRALVEEELAVREFSPEITRIVSVSSFSTPSTWQVVTDRGDTQFTLKAEEDIRRLAGRTRLMVASAEGVQYRIADTRALDRHSLRLLERFL